MFYDGYDTAKRIENLLHICAKFSRATRTATPASLIAQIRAGVAENWDGIVIAFIAMAATLLAALTGLMGTLISALGTLFAALVGRPAQHAPAASHHARPAREPAQEKRGRRKRG